MSLPSDFIWGFATAAYQIEGGASQDGRAPSIWDTFSHTAGKTADGKTGDVACNSYNLADDDIKLLKSLNAKAYRFSISWSRVIPLGGRDDPVNEKGIQHYVTFVDKLLEAGILPMVTLFHWDLPDNLDKKYGGLLNKEEFRQDFKRYAKTMFAALPKVKHWITFNEPWCSSVLGYNIGLHAPGRTSNREISPAGDSATECWIAGHTLLVAHGEAVKVYREEFKPKNGGEIGITLNGDWAEPWDPEDPADVEACDRKIEFAISWFADPVYFGKYPDSMKKQLGDRLPEFTPEEVELVKGSNDFYGMNHYTANYIKHKTGEPEAGDFLGNLETGFYSKAGENIGPETQSVWLRPSPIGFRKLLVWLSKRYNNPKIYVTENGTSEAKMADGEKEPPFPQILEDEFRCNYFRGYINAMKDAVVEDGVNVRGYMAWSLMDNFEWAEGYVTRFGVTYVDYDGGQIRHPKKSAKVIGELFKSLIKDS